MAQFNIKGKTITIDDKVIETYTKVFGPIETGEQAIMRHFCPEDDRHEQYTDTELSSMIAKAMILEIRAMGRSDVEI